MKTVYKYNLEITDSQTVELPVKAKILLARLQNGRLCLWAEIETDNDTEAKTFHIYGTGHWMPDNINLRYIDSVQQYEFVWHIYEYVA